MLPGNLMQQSLLGTLVADFAIQLGGWAVASLLQTEKFYDLTGSLTFISLALATLLNAATFAPRQVIMTALVCTWAFRLGSFLVVRVSRAGLDTRFDGVRDNPPRFLLFWTIQGVWVWITALPLWLVNGTPTQPPLGWLDAAGLAVWALGFAVEAVADWQKFRFKEDPANKGKFIDTGLWSLARHPNYGGEMTMWWGMFVISAGALHGGALCAAAVSPVFVMTLLLKVSGVPMLEEAAKKRWGEDPAFKEYRKRTRLLLPLPKTGDYEEF